MTSTEVTTTDAPPEVQTTDAPTQFATTVSNLVVTPQLTGVNLAFSTGTTVRAQVQIGTASGTYTTFVGPITTQPRASGHQLYGYNLANATLYHYIIQFYDAAGALLDATADATFTTLTAPAVGSVPGRIIGPLLGGTGVPANTMGADGNIYFRFDGAAGTTIYQRRAGTWVATAA
jgi:hypothetical protein